MWLPVQARPPRKMAPPEVPGTQSPPAGLLYCVSAAAVPGAGWRQANNSTLFKRWFLKIFVQYLLRGKAECSE